MTCDPWREAISARADGEPVGIDARLLDAHLAGCADCRSFAANVHELRRAAAVGEATGPNLAVSHIVRAARAEDRRSVWWVLRIALGVVAAQVFILSVPALLLGHSEGSDEHASRHIGSFAVAYAVGLLVVALRPAKARGMLPLCAALAGCLAITAVIDITDGQTPAFAEMRHLPEVVGLVLVWVFAVPRRPPARGDGRGLPHLSAVANRASERKSS